MKYIVANKEWIFSGGGVTALVITVGYFLNKSKTKVITDNIFSVKEVPNESIVSLYSFLPNIILRHLFKETRLSSLIKLDVRPRGESVCLNLGELPDCRVWLIVTNHSPFELDIENIKGELNYNGCRISIETKHLIDISKHSSYENVLLEGVLTGEQANHCSKGNVGVRHSLTLQSRIKTKLGVFKKQSGGLSSLNVQRSNKRNNKVD